MDDTAGALVHAKRALELEGESPRVVEALARALAAAGHVDEARALVARARISQPDHGGIRELSERLRAGGISARSWIRAVAETLAFWRR
jgi:hypothetical protein